MKLLGLLHSVLIHKINHELADYTDMLFFDLEESRHKQFGNHVQYVEYSWAPRMMDVGVI